MVKVGNLGEPCFLREEDSHVRVEGSLVVVQQDILELEQGNPLVSTLGSYEALSCIASCEPS